MRLGTLACSLLLVATPAIPGQVLDKPAMEVRPKGASREQEQPARQAIPPSVVNPVASPVSQRSRIEQKTKDDPTPISTLKPLDVRADVPKDWMDKLNWLFAGMLVLIGGFGVLYARRTLKAIEGQLIEIRSAGRQTDEMLRHAGIQANAAKVSADAARESVNAFVNSDRAWLFMDKLFDLKLEPPLGLLAGVTIMSASYQNVGKTVCRVKEARVRFHTVPRIEDLPGIPHYNRTDLTEYILVPGGKPINIVIPLEEGHLSEQMIVELRSHRRFLCFYLRVTYLDGHENERIFQECYIYYCPIGLTLQGIDVEEFRVGGPAKYREYT